MIAEALGIQTDAWRKWSGAVGNPASGARRPRGRKPGMCETTRMAIRHKYLSKYKQWGPAVLSAWAQRSGLGKWSATTVAKVIADLRDPPNKKPAPRRIRLTASNVIWSEDGAGFRQNGSKHELLALQDDFARYTVNYRLVDGPAEEDDVIEYLEEAFSTYGPPLVLKHDGGKIFHSQKMRDLLTRYQVEDLSGPRHYPQYNGRKERAFRDLRSFERALHKDEPFMPLAVRLTAAVRDLNDERPRPVLSGRTAAEVYGQSAPLMDRSAFRKEVDTTENQIKATARSRDEQESARRRAIEAVLLRHGYLEIRGPMSTDFRAQNKR